MKILFSDHFKKQLKKLVSKYPQTKIDLLKTLALFDQDKEISIGKSIYKIRIASSDMQKGKSGGFRAYLYLHRRQDLLLPLCIYPKSENGGITENELKYHFDQVIAELLLSF
jgi:mRNA-degrading endonuclease RelE of RelBE toxin-antitoxin system